MATGLSEHACLYSRGAHYFADPFLHPGTDARSVAIIENTGRSLEHAHEVKSRTQNTLKPGLNRVFYLISAKPRVLLTLGPGEHGFSTMCFLTLLISCADDRIALGTGFWTLFGCTGRVWTGCTVAGLI